MPTSRPHRPFSPRASRGRAPRPAPLLLVLLLAGGLPVGCAAVDRPPGLGTRPGTAGPPAEDEDGDPTERLPQGEALAPTLDDLPAEAQDPPGAPEACASIELQVERPEPTVLFVVDRSGSMRGAFFGDRELTRWQALRQALFGEPTPPAAGAEDQATERAGVVRRQASGVRFGMALFTSTGLPPDNHCPSLVELAPALDQAADLAGTFDAAPPPHNGKTPTGEAIDAVLDQLAASPRSEEAPVVLVLATDGDPDRCDDPTAHDDEARARSVDAVRRAHDELGIPTYVLALGQMREDHLQALANVGVGRPLPGEVADQGPAPEPAPFWSPEDAAGLEAAIGEIVGGTLSCELTLDRPFDPDRVCQGEMWLDDERVSCDQPGGGFRATSETTVELLGETCRRLRSGRVASVSGRFPCEVVLR
ncbi:MAG TPA: vWA domain-containing protein [Polyangiaceae bacterium LLY-WYZ-14_1]|nr:vWA domain-containing protein [Polyangiaceae bacterium LLY-WYZ-14_1]